MLKAQGYNVHITNAGINGATTAAPVKLISTYSQRVLGLSIAIEPTLALDAPDRLTGWLLYSYSPKYTSNASIPGVSLHLAGRRISFAIANSQ